MRTGLFVLLVCLVLVCNVPTTPSIVVVQSVSLTDSGNQLILAYQAVQKAGSLGAPSDQVAALSTQLNEALEYYNTAIQLSSDGNVTGSEYFSILSNNKSTIILANAIVLQNNAENGRTSERLAAYTTAIIGAMVSAILILEYHRIPNFLRKRKLFGIKLRQGDQSEPQN